MQRETQLGYLMEYLDVTGKELAGYLGTDTTTISKWRNNKRKLTYASALEIAKYVFHDKNRVKRAKVAELIAPYLNNPDAAAIEEQIEALSLFMTDSNITGVISRSVENSTRYAAGVTVFHGGIQVIQEAWDSFFDRIEPGSEVFVGDFGDIQWGLQENSQFVEYAVKKLYALATSGTRIHIVDLVGESYKAYEILFRWIRLYLQENVSIYYIEDHSANQNKESYYVLPGKMAWIGQATDPKYSENHVMLFEDKTTVDFYEAKMKTILEDAKHLIYQIELKNALGMVELLNDNLKENQLTYMLNPLPTFRNMPPDLLTEILRDNQVEERMIEYCVRINQRRHDIRYRCKYRQIYDLGELEQAVLGEYVVEQELGRIIGKEIRIRKEFFLRQLQYISDYIASNMHMLALIDFEEIGFPKDHTSIIVQEDSLVVAWNAWEYQNMLYSREITFIGGFSEYMKEIWSFIPLVNKSEEWTKNKLLKLADK